MLEVNQIINGYKTTTQLLTWPKILKYRHLVKNILANGLQTSSFFFFFFLHIYLFLLFWVRTFKFDTLKISIIEFNVINYSLYVILYVLRPYSSFFFF